MNSEAQATRPTTALAAVRSLSRSRQISLRLVGLGWRWSGPPRNHSPSSSLDNVGKT